MNFTCTFIVMISLHPSPVQAGSGPTVHEFQQLRELELTLSLSGLTYRALLSSITSINLQKVAFQMRYVLDNRQTPKQPVEPWVSIDKQLCELADRLRAIGNCHTLEAELRFEGVKVKPVMCDFTDLLPKFARKGVVTITDDSGPVSYSSSLNR